MNPGRLLYERTLGYIAISEEQTVKGFLIEYDTA